MNDTKFKSKYSNAQLLDAACVLIQMLRDAGARVSQRAFDARRTEIGYPDLPRADAICARLDLSWESLVRMSDRDPTGRAISAGKVGTYESDASWVTFDQIAFAMRLVALRLGRESITSGQYRRERSAIANRAPGRLIPTEDQIMGATGGWGAALAIAGLAPNEEIERDIERAAAVYKVLDSALEAHGMIPTLNELVAFARANELQLPYRLKPYRDLIQAWRGYRSAQGLECPAYTPRVAGRPDFGMRVIDGPRQRVRRGYWTEERAINAVRRFLDSREPGEPTTRKAYVDWSRGDRDAPAASHLDQHYGGFARVRRLAQGRGESTSRANETA